MAAAQVDELISDRHERRDSLAEFRKLEQDVRLETDFSNGFNSDDQSIPSAPPSSAGLDGTADATNPGAAKGEMFANYNDKSWTNEKANGVNSTETDDNNNAASHENGNKINANKNNNSNESPMNTDESEERPDVAAHEIDTSSTKSLNGSLRDKVGKSVPGNAPMENGGDELLDLNGGGETEVTPRNSDETMAVNDDNGDTAGGTGGEYTDDGGDQLAPRKPSANGVAGEDVQNNPNFVSPFSFHHSETGNAQQKFAVNNNKKAEELKPSAASKHAKHDDDEEDDEDDSSDDDHQTSLEKRTQDVMARKKANAAAREFEEHGKKAKTKVCTVL